MDFAGGLVVKNRLRICLAIQRFAGSIRDQVAEPPAAGQASLRTAAAEPERAESVSKTSLYTAETTWGSEIKNTFSKKLLKKNSTLETVFCQNFEGITPEFPASSIGVATRRPFLIFWSILPQAGLSFPPLGS